MPEAWTFPAPSVSGSAGGTVTLVEGTTFCISSANGDVESGAAQGLFYRDTRFISGWRLLIDDASPQSLAVVTEEPFAATFLARARPRAGRADSTVLVTRRRFVGNGMREDILLRNMALEPAACVVTLEVDADFAHLFEVKENRVTTRGERSSFVDQNELIFDYHWMETRRGLRVTMDGEGVAAGSKALTVRVVVPARGEWRACVQVQPSMGEEAIEPRYRCGQPVELAGPSERLRQWRRATPSVHTGHEAFSHATAISEEDLGALRIFDPDFPERAVLAAGAPWFMTLFGRDSLITSWMTLPVDPGLAVGTLQTLARFQGEKSDPLSEEEPGRILHEMRWGLGNALAPQTGDIYYGTADATPLFVMLLGELRRWGLESAVVDELLPHADRALSWVMEFGDADGDGFVEYRRATDRGLVNQGWKDSWDGVNFASGRLAEPPIALCEVQGYVYAAYVARAHFARESGDTQTANAFANRAARLKEAFNEAFWLEDEGYFAVGLDHEKAPIDAVASNIGHCLWTGVVDQDKATQVVARLMAPDMFSGWGIRTLSSDMGAYNPMSYHNGSVWPHDNALIAAGLMRYGFVEEAQRVALGLLDAAVTFGGRLPELFCGFSRSEFQRPVGYPTSCSPQAWSAAAPFSLLRTLLRFEPWVPHGKLWLSPAVPDEIGDLTVENVPLAGARLSISVVDGHTTVRDLPPAIELIEEPRHPLVGEDFPAGGP